MQKVTSVAHLKETIFLLEIKQINEAIQLKEQFHITIDKLKPANLIKTVIGDLVTPPVLKNDFLNTTLELAAGYFFKKILVGSTHNPIKQLLGTLLQIGITSFISKNNKVS